MKNKTLFLIGIILALIGYSVVNGVISHNNKKEASERLKQSFQIINTLEKKNDVLDQKNDSLERLYVVDSLQLDSLKKANTIIIASTELLLENKDIKQSNKNLRVQVENIETTLAECKEAGINYRVAYGTDKANKISEYAIRFETILEKAKL